MSRKLPAGGGSIDASTAPYANATARRSLAAVLAGHCNVLLVLLFVGIHTGLSVEVLTHYLLSLIAAVWIVYLLRSRIVADVQKWFLWFFGATAFICVMSAVEGTKDYAFAVHGAMTFQYNFFIGFSAYYAFMQIGLRRIRKTFFWIAIILVVGAWLEVIGIVKPLSDWFRESTILGFVYDADARDLFQYGAVRPKFFASEPSLLGMSIAISIFLWLGSYRAWPPTKELAKAGVLLVLGLYFVRSPTIIFGPVAYVLLQATVLARTQTSRLRRLAFRCTPWIYAAIITLFPLIFMYILLTDPHPPKYILTSSFFERVIEPYLFVLKVMQVHPFFGVGLLDDNALTNLAIQAAGPFGKIFLGGGIQGALLLGQRVSNALWNVFISFGVAGSAILIYFLSRLMRLLKSPLSLFSFVPIICFTFWQGYGRVNLPAAWFVLFAAIALCSLRMNAEAARQGTGV